MMIFSLCSEFPTQKISLQLANRMSMNLAKAGRISIAAWKRQGTLANYIQQDLFSLGCLERTLAEPSGLHLVPRRVPRKRHGLCGELKLQIAAGKVARLRATPSGRNPCGAQRSRSTPHCHSTAEKGIRYFCV